MKRCMILALLLVAGIAFGQGLVVGSEQTILWDAVTEMSDGSALPSSVNYDLWLVLETDERSQYDLEDSSGHTPYTSDLTYTVQIPGDGQRYVVGVRSSLNAGSEWIESPIMWCDIDAPNPWVMIASPPPEPEMVPPTNLRIQ